MSDNILYSDTYHPLEPISEKEICYPERTSTHQEIPRVARDDVLLHFVRNDVKLSLDAFDLYGCPERNQ